MKEKVAFMEVTARIPRGCPVLCRAHFNSTYLQGYAGIWGVCDGVCVADPSLPRGLCKAQGVILSSDIKGRVLMWRFMA